MAATRRFVSHNVGDRATNERSDVRSLQELLQAAGEVVVGGADGGWGDNTAKALESFQRKHAAQGLRVQRLVVPGDHALLIAAWRGNILLPMPGKSGMPGIQTMHDWLVANGIKYNPGAERGKGNRAIFGVHDDPRYAVQMASKKYAGPIEMDCTIYVNMMLSIFMNGNVHVAPYDATCSSYGGLSATHCARDRYGLPLIRRSVTEGTRIIEKNFFENAEQISAAASADVNGLYALEVALAGTGAVKHMALLYAGTVYECTTGQTGSACISRTLETFISTKSGRIYYLFGPSPTRR